MHAFCDISGLEAEKSHANTPFAVRGITTVCYTSRTNGAIPDSTLFRHQKSYFVHCMEHHGFSDIRFYYFVANMKTHFLWEKADGKVSAFQLLY